MANYHDARIPLELLNAVFGHTKSYPDKLLVHEVQGCEFHVISDGSAEIFFGIREDYDGSARLLPPGGPLKEFRVDITEEQALDCVAHSGVFDVTDGLVLLYDYNSKGFHAKISEDYIKQVLWEESKALVWSYLCLFGIGGGAQ